MAPLKVGIALALLSGALVASPSGPWGGQGQAQAAGATFVVTTTADSGVGSLRQAITDAELTSDDDTITFDPAAFPAGSSQTITLATTLPTVTKPLTILGPGRDVLAVSGDDTVGVMLVSGNGTTYPQGVPFRLSDITLTKGYLGFSNPYANLGAGLGLAKVNATLTRVRISDNRGWRGAGIAVTHSRLRLVDSIVSGNAATAEGGGIYNDWADLGEIYAYMDIINTTFTGNSAPTGGAVSGRRTTRITDSTFTGNTASGAGGAIWLGYSFPHSITRTTISGNSAASGGGIAGTRGWAYKGSITVQDSTVTGNTATSGDGSGGFWLGSNVVRILGSTFDNGAQGNCAYVASSSGGLLSYSNLTDTTGSTFSDNSCNQFDRAGLSTGWSASPGAGGTSILQSVGDPTFLVGDRVVFCAPNNCAVTPARSGVVTSVSSNDDTFAITTDSAVTAANLSYGAYGAVWVSRPKVFSVSPASGSDSGGDVVTITGGGFGSPSATPAPSVGVTFGGVAATAITHVDDTTLIVTTPPGAGASNVVVSGNANTAAVESNTLVRGFTYPGGVAAPTITGVSPAHGSESGGTSITITGTDLTGATSVTIGGAAATFTDDSATQITAITPAGTVGAADVVVTTGGGSATSAGAFTYQADPAPAPPTPAPAPVPAFWPPTPPTDVTATAGEDSVEVSWSEPAWTGTFPISSYEVVASPGGHICTTTTTACTFSDLDPGTAYTFVVRAGNQVGWSGGSSPSPSVTPTVPEEVVVITITGTRNFVRGRPGFTISGSATGLAEGAVLSPYVSLGGKRAFTRARGVVRVREAGALTWSRKALRSVTIYLQSPDGLVRSNEVSIPRHTATSRG